MKTNSTKTNTNPIQVSISALHPFENHPYKVIDNEEMEILIQSVQAQGIMSPLIVRKLENTENKYEVISGHRRLHAARKAGLETVPAFIFNVSRDEAAIMLVDSNLHREHILPSEKAFAYKLKMDAMSRQGERTDLTSTQVGRKLETAEIIGEQANESKNQVRRYIRLTYLIPELLEFVDEGKIALTPAVELSYLTEEQQYSLLGAIEVEDRTPSLSQAVRFKKLSQANDLTDEQIETIMHEDKANQKPMVKFSVERLQKVAPKIKEKELESFVMKACEHYYKYLLRQKDRDSR